MLLWGWISQVIDHVLMISERNNKYKSIISTYNFYLTFSCDPFSEIVLQPTIAHMLTLQQWSLCFSQIYLTVNFFSTICSVLLLGTTCNLFFTWELISCPPPNSHDSVDTWSLNLYWLYKEHDPKLSRYSVSGQVLTYPMNFLSTISVGISQKLMPTLCVDPEHCHRSVWGLIIEGTFPNMSLHKLRLAFISDQSPRTQVVSPTASTKNSTQSIGILKDMIMHTSYKRWKHEIWILDIMAYG